MLIKFGLETTINGRPIGGPMPEIVPLSPGQWLRFRGYLMVRQEGQPRFLHDREAGEFLGVRLSRKPLNETAIAETLMSLNGGFSAVIYDGSSSVPAVYLCSDMGGTRPLFHIVQNDTLLVSPQALRAALAAGLELNPATAMAMITLGFIPGRETMAAGLEQVKPGEIVAFHRMGSNWKRSLHPYWSLRIPAEADKREEEAAEQLSTLLCEVADDWAGAIQFALPEGARAAIPADASLESRIMLALLSDRLPGRLESVHYGDPRSEDAIAARDLSKSAGIPFHQIPATPKWLNRENRRMLARAAGLYCRFTEAEAPLALGEKFGAQEPKDRTGIAVMLPAVGGDVLSGCFVTEDLESLRSASEITETALSRLIHVFPGNELRALLAADHRALAGEGKGRLLKSCVETGGRDAAGIVQLWMVREYLHRFRFTPVQLYRRRFFTPLFYYDQRLLDFFSWLPRPFLLQQKLMRDAAIHLFTGKFSSFMKPPLQGQKKLTALNMEGQRESGLVRLIRKISPVSAARQDTPPLMQLWKHGDFREQIWQEIKEPSCFDTLFNRTKLTDFLEQRLGKDPAVTGEGVWNLLTVRYVCEALREEKDPPPPQTSPFSTESAPLPKFP